MPFGGADFTVSRTPEATHALQVAATSAVNTASRKTKTLREFTATIKEIFESANGVGWHVLAGTDFAVDIRYRKGACVLLASKKSNLKVILYRTTPTLQRADKPLIDLGSDENTPASASSTKNRKASTKAVWFGSDMDDDLKATVLGYAQSLLTKLKADTQATVDLETRLAQALKVQLSFSYGNTWHTIVSKAREVSCLPYCDPQTFADFSIDNLRIVLYKHNGVDVDTKVDMTLFLYRALLTFSAICFVVYSYFNYTATDVHTKCSIDQDAETEATIPEGCSPDDVASALSHTRFKSWAFIGLVIFTVLASAVRLYRRALRVKLKHG